MAQMLSCPTVISTGAGQPPIGKPLIVQARGQLRLTWNSMQSLHRVEKSHFLMVPGARWQEISRLRVSIVPGTLCPANDMELRSR